LAQVLSGAAKDAFDAAQSLVDRSDFAKAYSKFAQAYDLSSDPRLLFNMALCEGRIHDYARMKRLLARYQHEGGTTFSDEDRRRVGEALDKIESVVGTVRLAVSEPGSSVLVDGDLAGTTPLPEDLILNAGDHTLSVQKTGFRPVTRPLNITGGTATTMAVELSPQARDARIVLPTVHDSTAGPSPRVTLAWALIGAGTAAVAAGAAAGGIAVVNKDAAHCDVDRRCDAGPLGTARTAAAVADVGFVAGGALLAAGGTFFFLQARHASSESAWTVVPLSTGGGGLGVSAQTSW
jgi:hypothetical protein